MFDGRYFEWNQKRAKGIVDFYGHKFFYHKKVLDLGCGYGDIGGVLYRLGSDVTGVDARQEHLKIVSKKFSGIKCVKADLDGNWPFHGKSFDLTLDMGLLCHLNNFEAHLRAVCASTTNLVLETAVCDSDDPFLCVAVPENKGIYDLSSNGMGCRPTAAAVERVLTECGMNFKRVDKAIYNASDYAYDWQSRNEKSIDSKHRRIWFCVRNNSPIQIEYGTTPVDAARSLLSNPTPPMGHISTVQDSGIPVRPRMTASPRPPQSSNVITLEPGAPWHRNRVDLRPENLGHTMRLTDPKHDPNTDQVRKISKEFAIIRPEQFLAPVTFSTAGTILPTTPGAEAWAKNIMPLFPNLKVHQNTLTMQGFPKSNENPDFIMCSINNLYPGKIWIEEWPSGITLNYTHLNILKQCPVIMTPSLLNAEEILKNLPDANVKRVGRPWPLLQIIQEKGNYFVYFEKNMELTKILLDSWETKFGNLVVIGSSIKLPPFGIFVSDADDYSFIIKSLSGSKGIIDLTNNKYYMSGIAGLAKAMNIPLITNNTAACDGSFVQIAKSQGMDSNINRENLQAAITECINRFSQNKTQLDMSHNNSLNESMIKMMGE
jgi:SAM-dependent methyltransferase